MIKAPITDEVLIQHMNSIEKDSMSIFIMADGKVRGALFNGTQFVNQMRANHQLGILETMVLGQAALCGALMIPTMKGRQRLSFRYDVVGPAAGFVVEADSLGMVRGYLFQDPIPLDTKLESWDLSQFFGPGTLTITRFLEGNTEPVTGTVEILHKNIAADLTEYFLRSEQIKTAFNTSIQMDKEGRVIGAGGLFLQVLPHDESEEDAVNEIIESVEHAVNAAPSLGSWFAEGGNHEDFIYGLFREFNPSIALERNIIFECPCTRERFGNFLLKLDPKEFDDMIENGSDPIEIYCHNCGSIYLYSKEELSESKKQGK